MSSSENLSGRESIPSNKRGPFHKEANEGQAERGTTQFAAEKLIKILGAPTEGYSALVTDLEARRLSPELDKVLAETFSNQVYIVKKINESNTLIQKILNKILSREEQHLTTRDPREKYEKDISNIEQVIEQLKQEWQAGKDIITRAQAELQAKRERGEKIDEEKFQYSQALLEANMEVFNILDQEILLAKRGLDFLGEVEIRGMKEFVNDSRKEGGSASNKADRQLTVKHLPGGIPVILRGYIHDQIWQRNFGDGRHQEFGLAQIYRNAQYVAVEGMSNLPFGQSLKLHWGRFHNRDSGYDRLMRELVNAGFDGLFLETDGRYNIGVFGEQSFNKNDLRNSQAQKMFTYLEKYSPNKARRIGSWQKFRNLFQLQRTGSSIPSLTARAIRERTFIIKDGSSYHNTPSVTDKLGTSTTPTGLEIGQMAFSDALSTIKLLILNKAILAGKIKPGLVVDFQGAAHLHWKNYFLDHPAEAMQVVLDNVWEVLASHPDFLGREDILEKILKKLENPSHEDLDFIFNFISNIKDILEKILKKLENPSHEDWDFILNFILNLDTFHKVAPATAEKYSVEPGENQRKMESVTLFTLDDILSPEELEELERLKEDLTQRAKHSI